MNSIMWRFLFTILCVIDFASNVTPQPNFEVEKYTGKWYTIAVLMNLGGLMNSNSHHQMVELLKEGDLVIHIEMPEENCKKKRTWLSKGDQPGVFTTKDSTIYVLETDYDTYVILYVETPQQMILHLNAREPEASDEVRGKFSHLATILGLPVDQTIYLTKAGPCPVTVQR